MPTLPDARNCFACGTENPSGLRLVFTHGQGTATAVFTPRPEFIGYRGIVHGGLIATVLDEALAHAAVHGLGKVALTAEINIRFLSSLGIGQSALVSARITKSTRKILEAEATLARQSDGEVVARATGKLIVL